VNNALNKRRLTSGISAIAIAASLGFASPALAQAGTSTLRGRAPAGTQVVATEVNTGAVRTTTVGSDGNYVIAGLQAGNYHVTAGGKAADVVVPVASEQVQNFDTPVTTAAAGAIVVTGTRPTSEVHTSQVNQFVTLHDIAVLPQVTRNFLEFADTVPGMQFQVDANHNTSLRGGAQLASAVNVYIDGVSQKDLVGGGSGITGSGGPTKNGDPGNPFPQLAIAEYKVVTSNYSAEYGDAASSIIIAQTKSGTNRFQGEAFGTFTNQDLRAKTVAEEAAHKPKGKSPSKEYGAAFSGPIIKDVAHFFVTWEHKSLSDPSSVFPGSGISPEQAAALLPADVAAQYGPVTNPFTENLYFGKLDLEPGINDRIEATGKLRTEHSLTGGNGQAAASTRAPYVNNDKRADIRWQHSGNNWVNQVLLAYQNTNSSSLQTSGQATPRIEYTFFPNAANSAGGTPLIQVGGPGLGVGYINRQRGWTLKDDFTYTGLHLAGDHTLRAGVSFSSIKLNTQDTSSDLNNAVYSFAVLPTGVMPTPFEVQYPALTPGVSSANVTTTDKQYSAYVQDDWNVNRHLTLNLGLRWDHEVVPAFLDFKTPDFIVNGINSPTFAGTTETFAQAVAMGSGPNPGYNIFDYVSTGHNRKAPNNFSPRLGFSYDINGDNRHVIFGGYGRAYNRNLFSILSLEVTKIALNNNPQIYFPSPQTQDSFGACATPADINPANHCYAWNPAYLTPEGLAGLQIAPNSREADLLNNKLKTPYSDQFTLGMRNRIGDWNTQASVSLIKSYDSIIGRFGNRYANGAYFQNGSQWGAQGIPNVGTAILWDNGGKDRLFQIGLGAQKPYTVQSGWSATISYTFSAAKQNNVAGGSNPYSIANNQYLFDLPYPSDYPMIRATAVPRHRLVATYSRDIFWGISMASKLELATPPAAARIYCCTATFNQWGNPLLFLSKAPDKFIGYKDLDLQFTKNFSIVRLADAYVRVDILNVFNWKNYDPGALYYIDGPETRPLYDKNTFTGVPLTVKLTAGIRFGEAPPAPPPVAEAPPPPPPPPAPAPATQTCSDGSVILATATCPAPPPPSPPPAPAPERGQ
jgi:hypothetical protein